MGNITYRVECKPWVADCHSFQLLLAACSHHWMVTLLARISNLQIPEMKALSGTKKVPCANWNKGFNFDFM